MHNIGFSFEWKACKSKIRFVMQPLQNPPLCSRNVVIGVADIDSVATFPYSFSSVAIHCVGLLHCNLSRDDREPEFFNF
jgi:hypothetical protein